MRKKIFFAFIFATLAFSLTACGKKTSITFTDPTETSESNITRFDKKIAGEPLEAVNSLYDATAIYAKEDYSLVDIEAYGDNGLLVLYTGDGESLLSAYKISTGEEVSSLKLDKAVSMDTSLYVTGTGFVYSYDYGNGCFTSYDIQNDSSETPVFDFEMESFVVSDGGDCLYCTLEGDNNIYRYIMNTGKIVSVYEYGDSYKDVQVRYIENNGNYIVVLCNNDDGSFYERLDIENQERTIICNAEDGLYCAGEAYLTTSGEEDADVYVYNFSRPRLKDIFTLDGANEKNSMKLFSGSPYLLTSDEYIVGTKLRFYNVGRGVLSNEVVVPADYKVIDTDYLVVDQTLCIKAVNDKNERIVLLWDIENIGEIKN